MPFNETGLVAVLDAYMVKLGDEYVRDLIIFRVECTPKCKYANITARVYLMQNAGKPQKTK